MIKYSTDNIPLPVIYIHHRVMLICLWNDFFYHFFWWQELRNLNANNFGVSLAISRVHRYAYFHRLAPPPLSTLRVPVIPPDGLGSVPYTFTSYTFMSPDGFTYVLPYRTLRLSINTRPTSYCYVMPFQTKIKIEVIYYTRSPKG